MDVNALRKVIIQHRLDYRPAARQTVPHLHLHLHLIPCYSGDQKIHGVGWQIKQNSKENNKFILQELENV